MNPPPTKSTATAPDPDGPARVYALIVGAALVLGGIGGFFFEPSFATGSSLLSDDILGLFPTNGWDNVLHLGAGLTGLTFASRAPRAYALGLGALFTLLAVWGMIDTEQGIGAIADVLPVNGKDNLLHLVLGLAGLGAGLVTLEEQPG